MYLVRKLIRLTLLSCACLIATGCGTSNGSVDARITPRIREACEKLESIDSDSDISARIDQYESIQAQSPNASADEVTFFVTQSNLDNCPPGESAVCMDVLSCDLAIIDEVFP